MKAPTADYSPLSQALSAKNSAIQSGYAAKDAQNWKSRYEIQQKSLDLQQEAINDAKWQNGINLALNLADTYINYKAKKNALEEENENLELSDKSKLYGQGLDIITAKYGENATYEVRTEEEGPDGRYMKASTVQNPEMQAEIKDLQTKIFGSEGDWSEKSWKRIQNMISLSDGALQESMWQSYNKNLSLENDKLFSTQYSGLMTEAAQIGTVSMVPVTYDDGNGGKVTKYIPASVDNLIESRTASTETERLNMRIAAAGQFQAMRGSYLTSQAGMLYKNGEAITDTAKAAEVNGSFTAFLDSLDSELDRQSYKEAYMSSVSAGITAYFSNLESDIDSNSTDRYSDYLTLQAKLAPGGEYDSLFIDPETGLGNEYIDTSTRLTLKTGVDTVIESIRTQNGTKATSYIENECKNFVAQAKLNGWNSTEATAHFMAIFTSPEAYGDDFWTTPESQNVFYNKVMELLPKDLTKDADVVSAVSSLCGSMFPGEEYNKLATEDKAKIDRSRTYAISDIVSAILEDPGKAVDPVAFSDLVYKKVMDYDKAYWDSVDRATLFEGDAYSQSSKYITSVMDGAGKWFESTDVNEYMLDKRGRLDMSKQRMDIGRPEVVRDAVTYIGKYILETEGLPIKGEAGGEFQYKMKDGKPELDANGNIQLDAVVWQMETSYAEKLGFPSDFRSEVWFYPTKDGQKNVTEIRTFKPDGAEATSSDMVRNEVEETPKAKTLDQMVSDTKSGASLGIRKDERKAFMDGVSSIIENSVSDALKSGIPGLGLSEGFNFDKLQHDIAARVKESIEGSLAEQKRETSTVTYDQIVDNGNSEDASVTAANKLQDYPDATAEELLWSCTSEEEFNEMVGLIRMKVETAGAVGDQHSVKNRFVKPKDRILRTFDDALSAIAGKVKSKKEETGWSSDEIPEETRQRNTTDPTMYPDMSGRQTLKEKQMQSWDRDYKSEAKSIFDNARTITTDLLKNCSSKELFDELVILMEDNIRDSAKGKRQRGIYYPESYVDRDIQNLNKEALSIMAAKGWAVAEVTEEARAVARKMSIYNPKTRLQKATDINVLQAVWEGLSEEEKTDNQKTYTKQIKALGGR